MKPQQTPMKSAHALSLMLDMGLVLNPNRPYVNSRFAELVRLCDNLHKEQLALDKQLEAYTAEMVEIAQSEKDVGN